MAPNLTLADLIRLPKDFQTAIVDSIVDAREGRICKEHWSREHIVRGSCPKPDERH